MGTIGLGLVIASCSLPLKPQVNRVATDLKDLSRCTFSHAIQLDRVNDSLCKSLAAHRTMFILSLGCYLFLPLCSRGKEGDLDCVLEISILNQYKSEMR